MDRMLSSSLRRRLVQEVRVAYERQEESDVIFLRALAKAKLRFQREED